MRDQYTYLLVDLLCVIFPLAFSFHPKINFYKQWKYFGIPCALTALIFIVWDVLFTKMGVWSFNSRYVLGAKLFGLPLEEYLFFFCVPYACVFTYYCLNLFLNIPGKSGFIKMLTFLLIGFLVSTALYHLSQLYTSVTFLLLSLLLLYLTVIKQVAFLSSFYISFIIILIPFFISNGILTGSGLAEPVVLYNDKYNLGIRMITIPFEDTFYGMLLLLMNVSGFEYLKTKLKNTI
jgi:lycopene cyclase domain-containing protein